jgi:hypothetical protein
MADYTAKRQSEGYVVEGVGKPPLHRHDGKMDV